MARICDLCGKRRQIGKQSRHKRGVAGKQWANRAQKTLRVYMPNLHKITIDGIRMTLCGKCIKLLKGKKPEKKTAITA